MTTDPHGFDYAARLNAEQAAQQAAAVPPPLEPPFPWVVESFDPFFFGLDQEAVASSEETVVSSR